MPPHKNQVDFDPHTSTKYFSTSTRKKSQFRSLRWFLVNLDPHYKIKSILVPRHQNQVNFDPYTRTKYIPIPHYKEINYDPYSEIKSSSNPIYTESVSIQSLKPSHFRPLHKNQANSNPRTKTIPFSIPIQNQANFDPDEDRVIFDTHIKNKSTPIPTLKSSPGRSPTMKSSQFRPATQTRSQIRYPH